MVAKIEGTEKSYERDKKSANFWGYGHLMMPIDPRCDQAVQIQL